MTLPGKATVTVQSLPFVGWNTAVGFEVSTTGAGAATAAAAAATATAPLTKRSGGGAFAFSLARLRF